MGTRCGMGSVGCGDYVNTHKVCVTMVRMVTVERAIPSANSAIHPQDAVDLGAPQRESVNGTNDKRDDVDELLDDQDGIEGQHADPTDLILEPFNPELINISQDKLPISAIVDRYREDALDLTPDFQRNRGIWSLPKKSRLIESILLRIPLPVFYLSAGAGDIWSVVDGVQRLSTILDFMNGDFALRGLEYLNNLNGLRHDDLVVPMRRRIRETQLVFNLIERGTPERVMFNIFHRVNTGGLPLSRQEIRHAMTPGPAREYLRRLAESREFIQATGGSVQPTRMQDRELVLRFIAFFVNNWREYKPTSLDSFLGQTMRDVSKSMSQHDRDAIEDRFRLAMTASHRIFEGEAFRKPKDGRGRSPINRALFETWSTELAHYQPEELDALVSKSQSIKTRFFDALRLDHEFEESISYSTATQWRIAKRFSTVETIIKDHLS